MDAQLQGLRILIVEDAFYIAEFLAELLMDYGATVAIAGTIDATLISIDVAPPDVVLLDVSLYEGDTKPVADALVACGIPFAFHTGHMGLDWCDTYRDAPVVHKPAHGMNIVAALALAVAKAGRLAA